MKLTVRSLHKSFGDLHVLNGIDLDLESGRICCLMGPSGCGKTTLLRILMGLEQADSGEIRWTAEPAPADLPRFSAVSSRFSAVSSHSSAVSSRFSAVSSRSSAASPRSSAVPPCLPAASPRSSAVPPCLPNVSPRFSAVFQEDRLCEAFTPIENVMMVTGRLLSKAQVRAELARLLPEESFARPVATLSGGMKRRTAICRALLAPCDVIFMDEPFTGLDDGTRQTVISCIREKTAGRLTLISTHREEDVALLDAALITL